MSHPLQNEQVQDLAFFFFACNDVRQFNLVINIVVGSVVGGAHSILFCCQCVCVAVIPACNAQRRVAL